MFATTVANRSQVLLNAQAGWYAGTCAGLPKASDAFYFLYKKSAGKFDVAALNFPQQAGVFKSVEEAQAASPVTRRASR